MKLNNQIYTDEFFTKKFDEKFSATEYNLSNNRVINIVVNQSDRKLLRIFDCFIDYLIENNFQILTQFLFGNDIHVNENISLAKKYFNEISWPVTFLKQDGNTWSTVITAVKTNNLKPLYQDGTVIGNFYCDDYSDYCFLGGLMPKSKNIPKDLSIKSIFQLIESELNNINMDFKDIVRTWFYLDDLLDWYDEFNKVRNDFFKEKDIFNNMIPASTGIGAGNLNNSLLQSAVYSVKPKTDKVKISPVKSPFQCPASNYKSSFSRAVEIEHPDYRQLIISGTASINSEGKTAYIGDIYNQIKLTMNVVAGILNSRNMNWENVTKGIVYFKDINDIKVFDEYRVNEAIPQMPLAIVQADVCRNELLFEIEVDAIELKNIQTE